MCSTIRRIRESSHGRDATGKGVRLAEVVAGSHVVWGRARVTGALGRIRRADAAGAGPRAYGCVCGCAVGSPHMLADALRGSPSRFQSERPRREVSSPSRGIASWSARGMLGLLSRIKIPSSRAPARGVQACLGGRSSRARDLDFGSRTTPIGIGQSSTPRARPAGGSWAAKLNAARSPRSVRPRPSGGATRRSRMSEDITIRSSVRARRSGYAPARRVACEPALCPPIPLREAFGDSIVGRSSRLRPDRSWRRAGRGVVSPRCTGRARPGPSGRGFGHGLLVGAAARIDASCGAASASVRRRRGGVVRGRNVASVVRWAGF